MMWKHSALSRRSVLSGSAGLVLTGCSDLIGPSSAPKQLFMLRPDGGASTAGPKVPWSLSILTTTVSDHLDSSRIALTQADNSVDYFADAAWTDHLPRLVEDALVEAFENSGRIDAVSADSEGFHSDYILQAELRDFEARYDRPDGVPMAWVRIQSKIARSRGREIVANLNSVHQVQASENSIPAVVRALDSALGSVLSEIVNWALVLPPPRQP